MHRKNPASSTGANAPIELTPLLDVIFIILFIVIISNAMTTKKVTAEAESEAAAARCEVRQMERDAAAQKEEIESLEAQIFDQDAMAARYEQRIEELEGGVVGQRVKIITINCIYDENDTTHRRLSAAAPDGAFEGVDFGNDTAEMTFARLKNWLESYIEENLSEGDKSQRVIIVLSVGTERTLKRDRETLDRMIAGLEEKYDDVY